jgi:hypothetical protein
VKWFTIIRTIDGRLHLDQSYASLEDALDDLRKTAQECSATHRIASFDEEGGVLVLSYSGDDTCHIFVVSEEELAEYPLW